MKNVNLIYTFPLLKSDRGATSQGPFTLKKYSIYDHILD